MSGSAFVAQDLEIEPLAFDFRPYRELHGIVPEPTAHQYENYTNGLQEVYSKQLKIAKKAKEATEGKSDSSEEKQVLLLEVMASTRAESREMTEKMAILTASFCSNVITAEQFVDLPYRLFTAFSRWLLEQFKNPESQTPDTNS